MSNARRDSSPGPSNVCEPGWLMFCVVCVAFIIAGLFRPPWWLRKSASTFRRR